MLHRRRSPSEVISVALAPLALTDQEGGARKFVAHYQGQSLFLLPADRSLRKTSSQTLGLSRIRQLRTETFGLATATLQKLESIVSQAIGAGVTAAGMRLGPGGRSKLAVVFVDASARPMAIAKFPLTKLASESIAQERETILMLRELVGLSRHLPHVLAEPELGTRHGILVSIGPTDRIHTLQGDGLSFLRKLHDLTTIPMSIEESGLLPSWRRILEDKREELGTERSETLARSIDSIVGACGVARSPYGVAHGDFTRWNIRQGLDGLFVFDWESSIKRALPFHDIFHFFAAESALRGRPAPSQPSTWRRIGTLAHAVQPDAAPSLEINYLGYLVQTTLWYANSRVWGNPERPGTFWRFLWSELQRTAGTKRVSTNPALQ